jgi:hypothetical protein
MYWLEQKIHEFTILTQTTKIGIYEFKWIQLSFIVNGLSVLQKRGALE